MKARGNYIPHSWRLLSMDTIADGGEYSVKDKKVRIVFWWVNDFKRAWATAYEDEAVRENPYLTKTEVKEIVMAKQEEVGDDIYNEVREYIDDIIKFVKLSKENSTGLYDSRFK
jgi:hypothetical protein